MNRTLGKIGILGIAVAVVACIAVIVAACSSANTPSVADKVFPLEGPYVVNIPPMVPHSFPNEGDRLAELVVIFPTNVWEYDVLDYFPFKNPPTQANAKRGVIK